MIEPITIEKLKEYGFNDLMIERLFDIQSDYDCKVANDKGFFYASNSSGYIYSGEHGYDKFYNIGIDRFKTFEAMFLMAVQMGSIDLGITSGLSESNKTGLYNNMRSYYNSEFNGWLQKCKSWHNENEDQYNDFLTKEVWMEFLFYYQNKKNEQAKRFEADKESWKVMDKQQEQKTKSTQTIIYPNDLERADSDAAILKEQFKVDVNAGNPDKIYNYLLGLSDLLKGWMEEAKGENPERCKRGLIIIRYEALLWYQLNHIENSRCNIKLYDLKNELKWYIDETRRVYNSLSDTPKAKSESIIETPRKENIKEKLSKYGFHNFLKDQKGFTIDKINEIETLLITKEIPYCIALLNGLDYLDYFKREYCGGKAVDRDRLLANIFETIPRRIKGNINILHPQSKENRSNYTSYQYKESIDKLIKGR